MVFIFATREVEHALVNNVFLPRNIRSSGKAPRI